VDLHLLIFGALFVAIVLLLPGGLVQVFGRFRRRAPLTMS
jgi:ABC-type branched-subunit amino acid transport system permease subunit